MTQDTTTTGIAIPADVMEAANGISEPWSHIDTDQYEGDFASDLAEDIARAIMAERARCASTVEALKAENAALLSRVERMEKALRFAGELLEYGGFDLEFLDAALQETKP